MGLKDSEQHLLRLRLLEGVVSAYDREYATQNAEFGDIDSKAQATITVGGVFLAAALAFLKLDELGLLVAEIGTFILYLIGVVILLLVACVFSCTVAMRERWILGPLKAKAYSDYVDDLLELSPQQLDSETMARFLHDQIGIWREATNTMERALARKAKWVYWGQRILTAAMFLTAGLFVILLVSASRPGGGSP